MYRCRKCGGQIVTMDVDQGVTPFLIGCRADADCDGNMESSFYRIPNNPRNIVNFIWRKATAKEITRMDGWSQQHAEQGGLFLHPNKGEAEACYAEMHEAHKWRELEEAINAQQAAQAAKFTTKPNPSTKLKKSAPDYDFKKQKKNERNRAKRARKLNRKKK